MSLDTEKEQWREALVVAIDVVVGRLTKLRGGVETKAISKTSIEDAHRLVKRINEPIDAAICALLRGEE